MKINIHPVERVARVVVGVFLITLGFVGPANPWFFLGVIPVITGLIGWCPIYSLFGVSTCGLGRHRAIPLSRW